MIITDQGRAFHNQFNAELMSVFGIKHRMTTQYHPQANGLDKTGPYAGGIRGVCSNPPF